VFWSCSLRLIQSLERIDSYASGLNLTRTVTSAIPLLKLQNDDETKPLLPLSSDDPVAYESSPLATIRPLGANPSEVASQLLGPGPWPLRAKLHVPADCELLHPTSRSRDCAVQVTHALRFTMRLARGDDTGVDPKTGKNKLFEIVVRTPVHVLSVCYPSSSRFPRSSTSPG
jgi:arrestin-related trafficking adapter 3/6